MSITMEKAVNDLASEVRLLRSQQAELTTQVALLAQSGGHYKESLDSAHESIRDHSSRIVALESAEGENGKARKAVWLAAISLASMAIISAWDSFSSRYEPAAIVRHQDIAGGK